MTIEDYIPTDILKPFINTFKIIESQEEVENRVLPSTSLAMAFRFKGENTYHTNSEKIHLPSSTFTGLRKSARRINYSRNTSTLVVLFKEIGASAFFKEPLHEFFDDSVSLDAIVHPDELTSVEELLNVAPNNLQRVLIVENFLISKLSHYKTDKLIGQAVARIQSAGGFIKIRELTSTLYISNDAFEKRFRNIVGSSPKQFASIVRMSSIINRKPQDVSLLEIAYDLGYYDQSHFIKDFKLFTGQTPTDFFKSKNFW